MDDLLNIDRAPIVSDRCPDCGIIVGPHNESGWYAFVEGGTQPLCGVCEVLRGQENSNLPKADSDARH